MRVLGGRTPAIALLAMLLLSACGARSDTTVTAQPATCINPVETASPPYAAMATWDYYFRNVAEMAATADLVVHGTVTCVEKGHALGTGDVESSPESVVDVTVKVDAVLKGPADIESLVIDEEGYDRDGDPFQIVDSPWSRVGDTGYYFLSDPNGKPEGRPLGHFITIDPAGRILIESGRVVSFADTPLGAQLVAMTPGEMASHVEGAVREAVASRESPQAKLDMTITREDVEVPDPREPTQ